jgi:hypothetical protein
MRIEDDASGASAVTGRSAFTRGFLVRLAYGSLGILAVILVRPDFLGEDLHLLVWGVGAYLLVCLAGGVLDAAAGKPRRLQLLPKARAVDGLWLVLFVVVLFLLWQGR